MANRQWKNRYLDDAALEAIRQHKYNGVDKSIIYNLVLKHFWEWCVRFVPLWLAPNMITLLGTIAIVINYLVVVYYCPNFEITESCPRWVFLLCAVCLFWYQTMDNLDGKQARRTGSSSPLGQLFDHGCDSLVVTLQALITSTLGGFGLGWLCLSQIILPWTMFWLCTWEEYHTGVLYLGYINGPEEGIVSIVSLYIMTYFVGPEFWQRPYKEVFGLQHVSQLPDYKMNMIMFLACLTPVFFGSISITFKVLNHVKKHNRSVGDALSQAVSFALFCGSIFLWYFLDPVLWSNYGHWILCALGLAFGEIVSTLIIRHMSGHRPVEFIQRCQIPLFIMTAFTVIGKVVLNDYRLNDERISPEIVLVGFLIATTSSYIHFVRSIIMELTTFLKIRAFVIPYKKD